MRLSTDKHEVIKERGRNMKKKLLAVALCICTAFSVVACGGDDAEKKTEGKVTLGEYKGIEVDASLKEVAEEDLQDYLDSVLASKAETEEIKEGVLAKDDVVKIDYTCYVDDKEYKAQTGANLTLNEEGFVVDGFVDGIIGKNVGEEFELKLKFADDFSDKTVAGKDTTFKVKLIAKINTVIPEFTDEFVSTNFGFLELSTKDDLLAYLENDIIMNQVLKDMWAVVIDNATAESYDSDDLSTMTNEYADSQEYYIYQMTSGAYTLDAYLSAIGQSKDEFMDQMEEMAKVYLKEEMVVKAIAEAENIVITDEIYDAKMLEYAKLSGFETVEEFQEYYEGMTKEDFEYTFLSYLVSEFVCNNVKYVEGYGLRNEEETSTEGATGETSTGENESTTGEETTSSAE